MACRTNRSQLLALVTLGMLIAPGIASAQARRILEDRGPVESLDLYWGSSSPERAPAGPFTFVSEDLGGTNPKAILKDANGVKWAAKWDEEVHAEVAATRLAWAMGLHVEETYFVDDGQIVFSGKKPTFHRIGSFVDRTGRFRAARFERRDPEVVSRGTWQIDQAPPVADSGYPILVLMNVVLANWDTRSANTKILSIHDGGGTTDWYLIGDYGACFGKMGGLMSRSKYSLSGYLKNKPVVAAVDGQTVHLEFSGFNSSAHAAVPLESVRLFAKKAQGLSLKQVEDAFRAAHVSGADLQGFSRAVYERIQEVVTTGGGVRASVSH